MRRLIRVIAVLGIAAGILLSCGNSSSGQTLPQLAAETTETGRNSGSGSFSAAGLAGEKDIEAAFTLNYDAQKPEPESAAETVKLDSVPGGGQGPQIIPGLRELDAYETAYVDPKTNMERIRAIAEAQARALSSPVPGGESSTDDPLTVVDWGPRDFLSASVQKPSLFVIFSEAMVPLAALGQPSAASPFVTISPAIKGVFRWYGTGFLSFEAEEPCQSQQTYTITVSPGARSIHGKRISGETRFTFETERLSLKSVAPGEEFKKRTRLYFTNNSVPPEAAKEIGLYFNYPVSVGDITPFITISTGAGGAKRFDLTQTAPDTLLARLLDPAEFNTALTVTLKQGAKSGNGTLGTKADQNYAFRTPTPFRVEENERIPSYGKYRNLVEIKFSHSLNEETVAGKIHTEPAMDIGADNIEIYGQVLRIYNLPVSYGDKFTITVDPGIGDIYGRELGAAYTCDVQVPSEPPPVGEARFLEWDGSVRMLEAQFPPRLVFEYRNLADSNDLPRPSRMNDRNFISAPDSFYRLASILNPFEDSDYSGSRIIIPPKETNTRYFEEIDLSPYLNSEGKGFVYFNANLGLKTGDQDEAGKYYFDRRQNTLKLQVTDLGISARFAFNKAAVMVTSLATGKPVEGALVRLISQVDAEEGNVNSESKDIDLFEYPYFGEGTTDRNGLAVVPIKPRMLRAHTNYNDWDGTPYVYVKKDSDQAFFAPRSHNAWTFNIDSASPQRAEEVTPVTFMFSDRGLYKPGETLTFRGVDRIKTLGTYSIYKGGYDVLLEEDTHNGARITNISGQTTDSGGFHGSINIPDDLNPGSYRLVYRRSGEKTNLSNIPVTVAFFERLKFQASVSKPALTVVSGGDINMTLEASYLSGGSLSGSSFENHWFRELAWFRPSSAATKGYYFGPRNSYDSKRSIASGNGMLSANGTAPLTQRTGGETVTGAPYYYSVEAQITDISNQMISAYQSVMVHPAKFYLGILPASSRGFARAGQELSFDYLLVNTQGEPAADTGVLLAHGDGAGQMKVELIREEWNRVQQEGVGGYIYDRYTKELVTDSTQNINLRAKGSFKLKPSKAGFYILRALSADSEGKRVLTEYTFYVTGSGRGYWNMENASELRLTPDQNLYNPGDKAQVLLQSALPSGWYLITVEREGIFTEEVRYIEESTEVIEIPIARNFVPVVYVSVSSYSVRSGPPAHSYGSPDLDKPKGYWGVCRLNVNPRVRAFSVKVESDKKTYRPGEEVTMTLTAERDGRPLPNAELTLMAVDRGVLDLINYHVPDPIEYFYNPALFPLSVRGGDSRAILMDPVTYSVKNLAGGDEGESKLEERKDFNPTAVFEPMLLTGRDGKVTCKFKLPDSLTTYRVTVFGVKEDLFSLKESELAAQNRVNVREVLPRRMRERDTAEAGVLITNLDTASHKISVSLSVTPPRSQAEAGRVIKTGDAFVDGETEHTLTVKSGENAVVYFDVAARKEGRVALNFEIRSDVLNERLINELVIERPYVMETVTTTGSVGADSAASSEAVVLPSYADNGVGNLKVSLDATRLSLLESAVNYLFRYPYGCLEQRSSAVLPLVIFGEYLEAFGLKSEVSDPAAVVTNELKDWARCQQPDGGFPYWPSGVESNMYVSLRIAHVYGLAKAKNIPLPPGFRAEALFAYLRSEYQKIQSWREGTGDFYYQSYLQSYMLYVMSSLGENVDASRLSEILSRKNIDASVLAFAGMAYLNINRPNEAADAARKLRNLLRPTTRGVDLTDPLDRYRNSYYGGMIEQLALSLEFFVRQYPGDDINTRLLFSLLENKRAAGFWSSTAVTARVLSAVDALIRAENLTAVDVTGIADIAGTELLKGSFRGLAAKPVNGQFDFKESPLSGLSRDTMIPLRISRNGTGALYYTASLAYAIPAELQSFRDEGLGVFLSLEDAGTGESVSNTALESGKTYRAKVRVSSGRDRTYLALRVPVPSGAEILDAAFATTPSLDRYAKDDPVRSYYANRNWVSHQTIFDNEIQYFWDRFYKGETTVEFLFRTARRGVFPTPPVQAECMYEPEIFGRSAGQLYTIE